jgi:hypothetical protein
MTNRELIALLSDHPLDANVKLCVLDATPTNFTGGGDMTIEPSEDWPNAIVIFADREDKPA